MRRNGLPRLGALVLKGLDRIICASDCHKALNIAHRALDVRRAPVAPRAPLVPVRPPKLTGFDQVSTNAEALGFGFLLGLDEMVQLAIDGCCQFCESDRNHQTSRECDHSLAGGDLGRLGLGRPYPRRCASRRASSSWAWL
jgi:hypothetical protein